MLAGVLTLAAACSTPPVAATRQAASMPNTATTAPNASVTPPAPAAARRYEAGVELPEGPGRELIVSQCLNCHELASLELFSSFYGRESWRSLVVSMRANGAVLDDAQVDTVAGYLAIHFGTGAP